MLVHRGLTTLDVLVLAMIGVVTFDVTLGGLRSFVFSHTACRVDVQLGAKLFSHLLALPLAYFDSRPSGQTVARIRELETVRDVLMGSALTVVVDLVFALGFPSSDVALQPNANVDRVGYASCLCAHHLYR